MTENCASFREVDENDETNFPLRIQSGHLGSYQLMACESMPLEQSWILKITNLLFFSGISISVENVT
jgi:hypothetical protein